MEPKLTNRRYLGVVLPFALSTMTQPLLGAVNTMMMGLFPDPAYISGVALGVVLFNTIYWLFGFLRIGTTGYSAQALGTGLAEDRWTSLGRPLLVALTVSALILALQAPILESFLRMVAPEPDVAEITRRYFNLLVWGAPLVLLNYTLLGWLMGQAKIKAAVFMQISSNVLNIILSVALVAGLGHDARGVAAAALISQSYAALVGLWLVWRKGGLEPGSASLKVLLKFRPMLSMLTQNGNLVARTVCMMVTHNLFAASSASFGTTTLAANSVLLQLIGLIGYMFDGVGNANSLFAGRAVGRGDRELFDSARRISLWWFAALALLTMAFCLALGGAVAGLFSANPEVVATARTYAFYVALHPLCAGLGLATYGLYTGAMRTGPIRDMMVVAVVVFVVLRALLVHRFGNDGLWIAFLAFYAAQSVTLTLFLPRLRRATGFVKKAGEDGLNPSEAA